MREMTEENDKNELTRRDSLITKFMKKAERRGRVPLVTECYMG